MIPILALGAVVLIALALSGGKAHAAPQHPAGGELPPVPPPPLPPKAKEKARAKAEPKAAAAEKVKEVARDMAKGTATVGDVRKAADAAGKAGLGDTAKVLRKTADAAGEMQRNKDRVPDKVKQVLHGTTASGGKPGKRGKTATKRAAPPTAKNYRSAAKDARAAGLGATATLLDDRAAQVEQGAAADKAAVGKAVVDLRAGKATAGQLDHAAAAAERQGMLQTATVLAEKSEKAPAVPGGPRPPDWVDAVIPTHDLLRDTLLRLIYGQIVSSAQLRMAAAEARRLGIADDELATPLLMHADARDEILGKPEAWAEGIDIERFDEVYTRAIQASLTGGADPGAAATLRAMGLPRTAALAIWIPLDARAAA